MKNFKGKNNPNYKGGKNIHCVECNKFFFVNLFNLNRGRKYCSLKCKKLWHKKHGKYRIHICKQCHKKFKFHLGMSRGIFCTSICWKKYIHIHGISKQHKQALSNSKKSWYKQLNNKEWIAFRKMRKLCAKKIKYHIHHLDLNKNNNQKGNLLKLKKKTHHKLHSNVYRYLVYTGQIHKYLKWFNKHIMKLEIK